MLLSTRSSSIRTSSARAFVLMSTNHNNPTDAPKSRLVSALLLRRRRRRSSPPPPPAAQRRPVNRLAASSSSTSTTTTTTAPAETTTTTTTTPLLPPGLPTAPGRAVVVGAGPSGVAAAIALARLGFSVDVFERRPKGEGSDPRRTFGIVLGERALRSLERVGVDVRPLRRGRRMLGSAVATQQGLLGEVDCFADPAADDEDDVAAVDGGGDGGAAAGSSTRRRRPAGRLMVVERAAVVAHLLAEAERLCPPTPSGERPLRFHWSYPLASIDFDGRVATFGDAAAAANGSDNDNDGPASAAPPLSSCRVPYDLLVGADGASSAVRAQLEARGLVSVARVPSPASSMEYLGFHGLGDAPARGTPFFVPRAGSASGGTFFLTFVGARSMDGAEGGGAPYAGSVAMYRRPEDGGWSGIVALPPGKFDALFAGHDKSSGGELGAFERALDPLLPPAATEEDGNGSCARFAAFPAAWRRDIVRQLAAASGEPASIGRLTPLAAASAIALPGERVVLLGDAASSNTPQMGQGAGSALEDAAMLAARLEEQAAMAMGGKAAGGEAAAAAALLLGKQEREEDDAVAPPPIASALAAYAAERQPQRRALQSMERELAVFRRPPAPESSDGGEPLEDRRARRAWRAFMAQQKAIGQAARLAAAAASWAAALLALLGGGGNKGADDAASRKARIAARMNQLSGWTQLLHSGVPYDRLLARIHAAPAVNAALLAAAGAAAVGVAVAVARALLPMMMGAAATV